MNVSQALKEARQKMTFIFILAGGIMWRANLVLTNYKAVIALYQWCNYWKIL